MTSILEPLQYNDQDFYATTSRPIGWFSRTFPTFQFYRQFGWNVYRSSARAQRGNYDDAEWVASSHRVLESIESVGVDVEVSGTQHLRDLKSPCVFVANHMSMMETILLPCMIQPLMDVTFVVKQSLLDYPVFRHIVGSRNPIGVTRDNPREDFKAVIQEGTQRLDNGISIVIFPQTTRRNTLDVENFNTIGIKLAARANVPVVPIALQTDAWGNGRWIKDLGPIDPSKKVRFAFGEPIQIQGRGNQQHQQVIAFIQSKLANWSSDLG